MNAVLRIKTKGRVTIPKDCRDRLGLADGDPLRFLKTKSGTIVLKPVKAKNPFTASK